jgi:hypothetical protein
MKQKLIKIDFFTTISIFFLKDSISILISIIKLKDLCHLSQLII